MAIKAVIFDLDGVIVSTDEFHYQGWQRLADDEHIYFDRAINHRLRGVARAEAWRFSSSGPRGGTRRRRSANWPRGRMGITASCSKA